MESSFLVLLVTSSALDALVVFCVLFARRRADRVALGPPTITLGRVVLAAVVVSIVFLFKAAALRMLGLNRFGQINLVYVDLVIVVPLIGVAVLFAARRRPGRALGRRLSWPVRLLAYGSLAIVPVAVYATFVEPFRLQCETATVAVRWDRAGVEPLRIGVLADIQTADVTDYERDAVDRVMAWNPDMILLPGDVFQGSDAAFEAEFDELRDLIGRLDAPGGVFLVLGDVDGLQNIERLVEGTHVQVLHNKLARVEFKDWTIVLGGVQLDYDSDPSRRVVRELETMPGNGEFRILLAHRPDVVHEMQPDSRIDLVVAGHTHGGQVVVPFFGPPITLSRLPRRIAAGGLHVFDGNRIYISRGLGCERGQAPRVRFLCPPEISLLTLMDARLSGASGGFRMAHTDK